MKRVLKWAGIVLVVLVAGAAATYGWASWKTSSLLSRTFEVPDVDFPVPFPLTDEEIAELREERRALLATSVPSAEPDAEDDEEGEEATDAVPPPEPDPLEGVDLDAIALERAVARGRHLVDARYACIECHGDDFGGAVMVDDPAIGTLLGPNITSGGLTADYDVADWSRIVRHGVLPDGRPSAMPAEDFRRMSDRELSDIIAYAQTKPPLDTVMEPPTLGPLGTFLMAIGEIVLAADLIEDHTEAHIVEPPPTEPTAEFGEHLAGACTGCHREGFVGGPIRGGDPAWAPATNLTTLDGWTYEDFVRAMREMKRPDGSDIVEPMTLIAPYAERMTDVELQALWAYIDGLEAKPTGS